MRTRTADHKLLRARAMLAALILACTILLNGWSALAEASGMVRVRLTRLGAPKGIAMKADCDYYLASDPSVRVSAGTIMTVAASEGDLRLTVNGESVDLGASAKLMRASSGNRGLTFSEPALSNRFCGDLGLTASGSVITAVLNIYVENYLYGVVGYAMPPSSGIEALKAQAVAARTYALRKKSTRSGAAYDVTDTAADYVFKGYCDQEDYANIIRAVDETRGVVLYYGDALAQCYHCTSNGGQTESARNAWGAALDYTGVKDDPYDLASAAAVKTARVNRDLTGISAELKDALAAGIRKGLQALELSTASGNVHVGQIDSITPSNARFTAPSRLYKTLTFKINVTSVNAAGATKRNVLSIDIPTYGGFEDWYGLNINQEDNETVWVREVDGGFEISFRRQGHGVGLSQRGAQVMAGDYGKSMAEILSFYYPNTQARQLSLTDTTRDKGSVEMPVGHAVIAMAKLAKNTALRSSADDAGEVTASAPAGATVEVYAVQGEWAAVGYGSQYGYVKTDGFKSFALKNSTVVRAEGEVIARAVSDQQVLQLPVSTSKVVAAIAAGDRVQVCAWTDVWAMVKSPTGRIGFVPMRALTLVDADATPEPTPTPTPTATPEPLTPTIGALYARVTRETPLFISPNKQSGVLETLSENSIIQVSAASSAWAQTEIRNSTGGMATGYVPMSCLEEIKTDASGQALVDGGDVTKPDRRRPMYVQFDNTSLYSTWSSGAKVLATLPRATYVEVLAYNSRWACVYAKGYKGYVLLSALGTQKPTGSGGIEGGTVVHAAEGTYATARHAGTNVYQSYSTSSPQLKSLNIGEKVQVGAYNSVWAMVRVDDNVTGYALMSDLAFAVDSGVQEEELPEAVTAEEGAIQMAFDATATAELKLYATVSDLNSVIATIPKGAAVRVKAWKSSAAYVEYQGMYGYVQLKYLKKK